MSTLRTTVGKAKRDIIQNSDIRRQCQTEDVVKFLRRYLILTNTATLFFVDHDGVQVFVRIVLAFCKCCVYFHSKYSFGIFFNYEVHEVLLLLAYRVDSLIKCYSLL